MRRSSLGGTNVCLSLAARRLNFGQQWLPIFKKISLFSAGKTKILTACNISTLWAQHFYCQGPMQSVHNLRFTIASLTHDNLGLLLSPWFYFPWQNRELGSGQNFGHPKCIPEGPYMPSERNTKDNSESRVSGSPRYENHERGIRLPLSLFKHA